MAEFRHLLPGSYRVTIRSTPPPAGSAKEGTTLEVVLPAGAVIARKLAVPSERREIRWTAEAPGQASREGGASAEGPPE